MTRRLILPLLLILAGCAPARPGAVPGGGIVSTNPCADAMLVRLVPPARIAAISRYSRDPGATSIPLDLARRFRAVAGTAEEVIALRPSLVLASSFTPAATLRAYDRAGLKVLTLDSPMTIAASIAQVRAVARAVGEPGRGEALATGIERAAAIPAPAGPRPRALLMIGDTLANGPGTLLDDMMARAGLANAAAGYGLAFSAPVGIEAIARHPPDILIATTTGQRARLRAKTLADSGAHVRTARIDRALMNCGGPVIPVALARLRQIRAGRS